MRTPKLIVLGASAGGVAAINSLLGLLPERFPIPLATVLHLPANARVDMRMVFGRHTSQKVVEIEDKMRIEPGHIYFAPPAYHTLVESDGTFALSQDDPVNFSRPSIDVFFESAADAYGTSLVGVILTGANGDGAKGMRAIQQTGGRTVVQHPNDAEVGTMPQEALKLIHPDHTLALPEIAKLLCDLPEGGAHG